LAALRQFERDAALGQPLFFAVVGPLVRSRNDTQRNKGRQNRRYLCDEVLTIGSNVLNVSWRDRIEPAILACSYVTLLPSVQTRCIFMDFKSVLALIVLHRLPPSSNVFRVTVISAAIVWALFKGLNDFIDASGYSAQAANLQFDIVVLSVRGQSIDLAISTSARDFK
jgi:hypothetical protein